MSLQILKYWIFLILVCFYITANKFCAGIMVSHCPSCWHLMVSHCPCCWHLMVSHCPFCWHLMVSHCLSCWHLMVSLCPSCWHLLIYNKLNLIDLSNIFPKFLNFNTLHQRALEFLKVLPHPLWNWISYNIINYFCC